MEQEKKNTPNEVPSDETGYINTEELRDVLNEEKKEKKESWFKRLFKKKNKEDK